VHFGWAQRSSVASGMTAGSLAQILSPKATQLRCHLLLKRRPREATQSGNSGFRVLACPAFPVAPLCEILAAPAFATVNRNAPVAND